MVNRSVIVGRNGQVYAAAENKNDLAAYGQFQTVSAKSGENAAAQARERLAGRTLRGEVTVLGNLNVRCGTAVELHRPEWGLDGVYAVTAAEHRWAGGLYTTTLALDCVRQ